MHLSFTAAVAGATYDPEAGVWTRTGPGSALGGIDAAPPIGLAVGDAAASVAASQQQATGTHVVRTVMRDPIGDPEEPGVACADVPTEAESPNPVRAGTFVLDPRGHFASASVGGVLDGTDVGRVPITGGR